MSPSAIGARRRITALFFNGWSPRSLAAATGLPEVVFTRTPTDLERRTDPGILDQIGEAYERLWNASPPKSTEGERAEAELFSGHARTVGWAPPMAYDDDTMDEPDGGPAPGWQRVRGGHERRRAGVDLAEDIEWVRQHGGYRHASTEQLALRLGMTRGALERSLARRAQLARAS